MQQSPELMDLMSRFYQAYTDGSVEMMEGLFSEEAGSLFIGTDPDEWFTDRDAIMRMMRAQLQAKIGVDPGEMSAYREGSVGWTSNRGAFQLPDGTNVPFRLTMVVHQEGDDWKVMQVHTSFPVSNEEAVGTDLTG